MKKLLLILAVLLTVNTVNAEPITITPVERISTTTKYFQLGSTYKFKNTATNELITGTVVFYRPNGFAGQEAQIEISNFKTTSNKPLSGTITIIPSNHKNFQEFNNYFSTPYFAFVRGSEIILEPEVHTFTINETSVSKKSERLEIKPAQDISTTHDEIELGDAIKFVTLNETSTINKNTPIYGVVDYLDENGVFCDSAAIYIKKFVTRDKNGNKITINYNLKIDGFETLKFKSKRFAQFFNYIGVVARGKEVDIKSYDTDVKYNIFVN